MISLLCLEFRSFLIFSSSFVVFSCKILFTVASPSSAILIISKNKTSSNFLSENIWVWIIWASVCSNVCNGVCNLSDNTGWLRRRVKRGLAHQIHLYDPSPWEELGDHVENPIVCLFIWYLPNCWVDVFVFFVYFYVQLCIGYCSITLSLSKVSYYDWQYIYICPVTGTLLS